MQMFYNNVIAELKDQISSLTSKLNQSLTETTSQPPAIPTLDYNPAATTTSPSSSANAPPHKPSAPVASSRQDSTRKFNIVLFGLDECSKGTKKIDREKADLNNAAEVLTGLENSVQPHSIRDTIRLGKYNPSGRPRPLLVTLNRSSDVNSILLQRSKLKSPFVIKPDLSREARATESHLLKVRWSLMQKNISKSDIKIRGNKIYVKGKLHGQADSLGFSLNDSSCGGNGSTSHQNMDTSTTVTTPSS